MKIKIGGHNYSVFYVKGNHKEKGIENYGKIYHDAKKIYIDKDIAKSQQEETLLHEILHAIDQIYNNHSLSEKQIESMSEGLYQVLKDNKTIL